jgi:hypothetical protein
MAQRAHRCKGEQASSAEAEAASLLATVRALEAELALAQAAALAAGQREGGLRSRLESGKQRGANFDSILAQFQVQTGNNRGTIGEQSGNNQGTIREQSGNNQGTFSFRPS